MQGWKVQSPRSILSSVAIPVPVFRFRLPGLFLRFQKRRKAVLHFLARIRVWLTHPAPSSEEPSFQPR
jgi:hypothetical protein